MNCQFCGQAMMPTQNRCPNCGRALFAAHGDHTVRFNKKDIDKHHIVSVFSYLSFLVLIPILFARRSLYARFHANQGLVLMIITMGYTLATRIFVRALELLCGGEYAAIPMTLSTIFNFGSLLFLVLMLIGMINAANGKAKELPLIGRLRFLL